jgi:alkylhydroperoxidase family enzyme
MTRIPYVEPQQASEPVREALDALPPLNIFRLMANAETAFRPWLAFGGALLGATKLDPVLRELAILRVAALTPGAEYEWVQHEQIASDVGATGAQIDGARTGEGLEGDDALIARFTEQVVRDATPDDETFAAASQRFDAQELLELLLVIGQYMMVARVMATAQIDLDPAAGMSGLNPARDQPGDAG